MGFEEIYPRNYLKITEKEMPCGSQTQTNNPRIHLLSFILLRPQSLNNPLSSNLAAGKKMSPKAAVCEDFES